MLPKNYFQKPTPECYHDETQHLGAIWTKCTQCGHVWEDQPKEKDMAVLPKKALSKEQADIQRLHDAAKERLIANGTLKKNQTIQLQLMVEYDEHEVLEVFEAVQSLIENARQYGRPVSAKLVGMPNELDIKL